MTSTSRHAHYTAPDPFSSLQLSLQPVDLMASDKAPSTPDALEAALYAWLDSLAPTATKADHAAFDRSVRTTVGHLKVADCRRVLDYHRACASASKDKLYHPVRDGPIYGVAFARHIGLALALPKGNTRKNRDRQPNPPSGTGRKRPAARGGSTDPEAACYMDGHGSHTNAECRSQHPLLRTAPKSDGQRQAPAAKKPRETAAPAASGGG